MSTLAKPEKLKSQKEEFQVISSHVQNHFYKNGKLRILEAGCGRKWALNVKDCSYVLTGIDINIDALKMRKNTTNDLDFAILGDLKTLCLKENQYDIIYNSYVLEHVDGAAEVLTNFKCCLKPGGIIIIRVPNRHSVVSFIARFTPFWFHVFYKKYLRGNKNAGKPGYDPFPTYFDKVISRKGIYEFCEKHSLTVKNEYYVKQTLNKKPILGILQKGFVNIVHYLSVGMLDNKNAFIYIIEKPETVTGNK